MKKSILIYIFCCGAFFLPAFVYSQSINDSSIILQLNQQIDTWILKADTTNLSNTYTNDFVFSHGSGRVDSKQSWLVSVSKGNFLLRQHDSVKVELHPHLAIVRGKLYIEKKNKEKKDAYYLWYIRVFIKPSTEWLLTSHTTYFEKHL